MSASTLTRRPSATARRSRPRLTGRPRRLVRAVHVTVAGGWLGLVVAMLVLGLTARGASSTLAVATVGQMARVGGAVIPPFAVATLVTGVALSVLTTWGLVRHWWVVAKIVLGLAVIGSAVTLTDAWLQRALADPPTTAAVGGRLVVLSMAHLAMLAVATIVSVDKPWGLTPWTRPRQPRRGSAEQQGHARQGEHDPRRRGRAGRGPTQPPPRAFGDEGGDVS